VQPAAPGTGTDALALATIAPIRSGMVVGLGTGRTSKRVIRALAERIRGENLDVHLVSTSEDSTRCAQSLGLAVGEFSDIERVDYLFDGADEVDPECRVLKGAGGAMTRERMVAWAADRCVYMVDQSKLVDRLGQNHSLAIAILFFGYASVRARLREMGLTGVCRREIDGKPFITDNGNVIIDVTLEDGRDIEELARELNDTPGVIDHGLFLDEADEILVDRDGEIERITRQRG
jgi:ribose 5-phosphate isomerase A